MTAGDGGAYRISGSPNYVILDITGVMKDADDSEPKPVFWMGTSKKDLSAFPDEVKSDIGQAIYIAQIGGKAPSAKPMTGIGAGVVEVVEDHDGDTYRAVYTVAFKEAVYVLHAFQKKSKRGIATPRPDIDKIKARLKGAKEEHVKWIAK